MSLFKDVWTDLTEKRLWPVALALVVALAAVPFLLGGASGNTPTDPRTGATGATGAAAQTAQVTLDLAAPLRRDRAGKLRDPFKPRKADKPAEPATGAVPTGPAAAGVTVDPSGTAGLPGVFADPPGSGGPSPDLGADLGAGPGTPEPPKSPPAQSDSRPRDTRPAPGTQPQRPRADPLDSYVATLRLGRTDGKRPAAKDVERLTPLPSAENAFLAYLGVLSDKKTAVFLLSSDVVATGDGVCKPRKSSCETIELQRGDTVFLDVTADDGEVTQYELQLLRVTKEGAGTPAPAVKARSVASSPPAAKKAVASAKRAGASAARRPDEDTLGTDRYAFDDETGLLRRVKNRLEEAAALPSAPAP